MKRLLSFFAAVVLLGAQSLEAQWIQTNGPYGGISVTCFAVSGSNLFAGASGSVFLSTNNGTSWTAVNTGLQYISVVNALAVNGSNLFAGTDGGGVWRRPLPEMVTAIEDDFSELPIGFALEQNYPNPFNPETVISYQLPVVSEVRLTIFNALGREIRTLMSGHQSPGVKSVVWDGNNDLGQAVNSGMYFCTLKAGEQVQTKKMVLMR